MGGSKQASASQNIRRVNTLKQRRRVRKNNKVVKKIDHGSSTVILKTKSQSKKKVRKDLKRLKATISHEKKKMIDEGVVTKEELESMTMEE